MGKALALDDATGATGASSLERTQAKAEKNALANCRKQGGEACRMEISYHNQCIGFVVGKTKYFVRADYSLDLAVSNSLDKCTKENEGCRLIYSSCSLPERVR
ncbi:DUF4189 domain-containing protein [Lysobacter enzymogenes]|nr:DUF4189 domain-containing protein [Lysobacter enzymogenes]